MRRTIIRNRLVGLCVLVTLAIEVDAQQQFQATMYFPVIFYDYRAQVGSSSPFENISCATYSAVLEGLVSPKLDPTLRKPVRNPNFAGAYPPICYQSLGDWFYPSGTSGRSTTAQWYFDTLDSTFKWANLVERSPGVYRANDYSDTYPVRNVVLYDSLPFTHIGNGVYQFERLGSNGFFWLDGRGFGNEPSTSSWGGSVNPPRNFGFTMELHHNFVYRPGLRFDFLGDDDVWVFINDSLVLDLGGAHVAAPGSLNLDDPGFRNWLKYDQVYHFDFFYCERLTTESNIRITTNILTKQIGVLLIGPSNDTLVAGQKIWMEAKLLTTTGDTLLSTDPEYGQVTWQIINPEPGDTHTNLTGRVDSLSATKAHRLVTVRATYSNPWTGQSIDETAQVYVIPGPPHRITAESSPTASLWTPNDLPQVVIPNNLDTSQTIYAFVRDRWNNLIIDNSGRATLAQWSLSPPEANQFAGLSVVGGKNWQGQVIRIHDGHGTAQAAISQGTLIPDTVTALLSDVDIVKIRVVDAVMDTVVTGIFMTTDDVITLRVEGLPSNAPNEDDASWVTARGVYTLPAGLTSETPPGAVARTDWDYRPNSAGSGNLAVSYPDNPLVDRVSIPVVIITAPPSRITFELLDLSPVAGVRFRAKVSIYNGDGLVPNTYCYPNPGDGKVRYADRIDVGTDKPDPRVFTAHQGADLDTGALGFYPSQRDSVYQCFTGGVDTVEVVLYNAANGADHQLYVRLSGKNGQALEASTNRFVLKPGPVDNLVLIGQGDTALAPTVQIQAPTGTLYAASFGYDAWGNPIGVIPSYWSKDGTLRAIPAGPVTFQYYRTDSVGVAEQGCIVAVSQENPDASDTVCITVIPAAAIAHAAYTRDVDGNGYLDRIELHFTRNTAFPRPDVYSMSHITVQYAPGTSSYSFTASSVRSASGAASDSVWYVNLTELVNNVPQTAWVPRITITDAPDMSVQNQLTTDGAGPVIWRVLKEMNDMNDRRKDQVTVEFSENLKMPPGPGQQPKAVLVVWYMNEDSVLIPEDLLERIGYFGNVVDPNASRFYMLNGENLTLHHYVSIRVTDGVPAVVVDKANEVPPNANNKQVRVQVIGPMLVIKAGPNPFIPSSRVPNDPVLVYRDPRQVARWALENGGSAIVIQVQLTSQDIELTGSLSVYDLVGNLVYYRESDGNLAPDEWRQLAGTQQEIGFYWNGFNDWNMRAQPGMYRALVKVNLHSRMQEATTTDAFIEKVALGVKR